MYDDSMVLVNNIRQIVQWLEGADEEHWPDQTRLAVEVLADVQRMGTPTP